MRKSFPLKDIEKLLAGTDHDPIMLGFTQDPDHHLHRLDLIEDHDDTGDGFSLFRIIFRDKRNETTWRARFQVNVRDSGPPEWSGLMDSRGRPLRQTSFWKLSDDERDACLIPCDTVLPRRVVTTVWEDAEPEDAFKKD